MLHIKRLNQQSVVSFREKERLISPCFLMGSLLAICFHLAIFFTFKIVHPKAAESVALIPSLSVEVAQQVSTFHNTLETTCLNYQTEPLLPAPFIPLPRHPSYEKTMYNMPEFTLTEDLDYEYLDIDFDDDRD